jgi:hypothetical protein
MAANPLRAIVRLRQLALDQARRELCACSQAEQEADRAVAKSDTDMERERRIAADLLAGPQASETFARSSRIGRTAAESHRMRQDAASASTMRARAHLSASRADKKAAEQLLIERAAQQTAEAGKRAQLALEEAARHGREGDEK